MPVVTLTEEHRYFVDGTEYDGVTNILRAEGFMSDYVPADLDWYLERGRMIHKATEYFELGILDESTVDERIRGYLASWKLYREHTGVSYQKGQTEITLIDELHKVAGTLDRPDCDIKSGTPERWHIFQIGAYRHLATVNNLPVKPYRTVYLQEDGSLPKVKTYSVGDLIVAGRVFLCALMVHRAKRDMGV